MREREKGRRREKKDRKRKAIEEMPVVGSSPEEAGRQVYPPPPETPQYAAQPGVPGWPPPTAEAAPAGESVAEKRAPEPPRPPEPAAVSVPPLLERQGAPPEPPQPPPVIPAQPPADQPTPPATPAPGPPQAPPPLASPPGYFYPPPPWYPMPYVPPGYGMPYQLGGYPGMPQPGAPMEHTGRMPVVPPPGFPPGQPPAGFPPPFPTAAFEPLDDEEFEELARPRPGHWRADLKWVFGIITLLLLFLTLTVAGAYRVTGPGAAKQVLTPLIESATEVKEEVKDNYQDLRSKARRLESGSITIPDVGMSVSIEASAINDTSAEELADQVVLEIERQTYSNGYTGDLPMKEARGAGEERARAVAVTLLSEINRQNHQSLLWVLLILAVLALAFAVPFVVFCAGWGRVTGPAIAIILATASASLVIRICSEFLWRPGARGSFRPAAWQALRSASSTMVVFFDVALGAGAILLLVGVIGNILSKRSRERVPPFVGLKRPEEAVVGGSPLEPGLEVTEVAQGAEEAPPEAFKDLEPPPGEQ